MKTCAMAMACGLLLVTAACSAPYYGAMEKLGIAKRDILVSRVKDTRDSEEKAKEQITSALDRFIAVTKADGGDLQRKYDELNREFSRCELRAKEVKDRIAAVEDVAEALFREWRTELKQYSSASMRRDSERELDQTRSRYEQLIRAMRRAAERMEPVLGAFRDQVLFLKHNLNAKVIASLSTTQREIETDVNRLIADMEASIKDAEEFIRSMQNSGTK